MKIMLFLDGTWLYANMANLRRAVGADHYAVDFGKLPGVLASALSRRPAAAAAAAPPDVVRTYLFGSYATNSDPVDAEAADRRRAFFDLLTEEFHYEVELFPIDFRGRRLRRVDRDPADPFEPREKQVDVALASTMLFLATQPAAFDVAVVVVGDSDFVPALQYVRRLGKRVAIASIRGSCSEILSDPLDRARVKDFDIVWLDDLVRELELVYEKHTLACESPTHEGPREVETTFHPRRGQKFYCPACLERFKRQREEREPTGGDATGDPTMASGSSAPVGSRLSGRVKSKKAERGFGFIESPGHGDYYFHLTNLRGGLTWHEVAEGAEVEFEVRTPPAGGKAGTADDVRSPRNEPGRHDLTPVSE
jgi:cold shock CspA family protein